MKLLIVTQTVDLQDPVLGFFHRWLEEFAEHCEQVTVVCLNEGEYTLPSNVRILSLGKEKVLQTPNSKLQTRLRYLSRFYSHLWRERSNYDAVFVHMNPEYVVLGAPVWRVLRKRVTLWYTHKSVTRWLRMATRVADAIFTASKESFRIQSDKVHVVGHGIDVALFTVPTPHTPHPTPSPASSPTPIRIPHTGDAVRLVSVGRISRTKRQDLAIEALALLRDGKPGNNSVVPPLPAGEGGGEGVGGEPAPSKWNERRPLRATLTLIGTPLTDVDRAYETELRTLVAGHSLDAYVVWAGAVPNTDLPAYLAQADVLVHTSETGSLDKVVLEALAAGVLLVTTSQPVRAVLPQELGDVGYSVATPEALADRIIALAACRDSHTFRALGRTYVETQHALSALITRILATMV